MIHPGGESSYVLRGTQRQDREMQTDWSEKHRALKAWLGNKEGFAQLFGSTDIRREFDSSVQRVTQAVIQISNQLLVFTPSNWETEDDWLLSKDQWRYLMVLP